MIFVAKTLAGLETVLAEELAELGAENIRPLKRAVHFEGDKAMMYKVNYCCRTALRVLMPIRTFTFHTKEEFFNSIYGIEFSKYLDVKGTFCIDVFNHDSIFSNSQYVGQYAKDALCDRFRDDCDRRPSVDKDNPDVVINIHVAGKECTVSLDSSGSSLHLRGYKVSIHPAPINEVLAAGILRLLHWQGETDLYDPMCGSATFLIEAAMIAQHIPAGHYRDYFGFINWKDFDADLWRKVETEAEANKRELPCRIYGSDISRRYLGMARENIEEAGLESEITLSNTNFFASKPQRTPTTVVFNPPYGERLQVEGGVTDFYRNIGNTLKQNYVGCNVSLISSDIEALKRVGLKPSSKHQLYNGKLECRLFTFELYEGSRKKKFNASEEETA